MGARGRHGKSKIVLIDSIAVGMGELGLRVLGVVETALYIATHRQR